MKYKDRVSEPIHRQIWSDLFEKITSGYYSVGQQLPTEAELQRTYGASRTPIRKALDRLELDAHIVRRPGRGTFVKGSVSGTPRARLSSFSHYYRHFPGEISAETRLVEEIAATKPLSSILGIPENTRIVHLQRARSFKGTVVAYLWDYYRPSIEVQPFLDQLGFQSQTEFIRRQFGIRCAHADEQVSAILPSPEEQDLVGLDANTPVLQVERTVRDDAGEVIVFSRYIVDSTRWVYRTSLDI